VQPAAQQEVVPRIRGIFVVSHVAALRARLGDDGVRQVAALYGCAPEFRAAELVPVREEVRLLECIVQVLHPDVPAAERSFEAGRLHFRNFEGTPWARLLFGIFPRSFRFMVLHAGSIAERVFEGVRFEAEELGPDTMRVVMENGDYPMEHFRGLFHQWMESFGLTGTIVAQQTAPRRHEYVLQWLEAAR